MNALQQIQQLMRSPGVQVSITDFVLALVLSVVSGLIISIFYQVFYENRATASQIHRSFLLIAPSITALFIAIQFSLPLSLGLIGALTINRFRTPIKEPEEVGFIMLVIATVIVCATFNYFLLVVLLALALVVLLVQRYLPRLFRSKRSDSLTTVHFSFSGLHSKQLEGLEASLKEVAPIQKMNIFFNRQGVLL
jgi:chromate transport protein ChrA